MATTVTPAKSLCEKFDGTSHKKEPVYSRGHITLRDLLECSLVLAEDWDNLPLEERKIILQCKDTDTLLDKLQELQLLNEYQAARIRAGTDFGLILGNYRVIDRLGAGAMGTVFQAEHMYLKRVVAIKVMPLAAEVVPLYPDEDVILRNRFYSEMRSISQLQHPNIISVFDAGKECSVNPEAPVLHYFAMEYVPGMNLRDYVQKHGPMSPVQACDVVYQIAGALAETCRHNLVHRDIKPSNILLTNEGQAKLLDFGLVRRFGPSMTEPGTVIGTIDYMAPEQAQDPRAVDIRADIYGLGGTLYWCLTGHKPFPSEGKPIVDLSRRLTQPPPSAREIDPTLPVEIDRIVSRMMATRPKDRFDNPVEVQHALIPLLQAASPDDTYRVDTNSMGAVRKAAPSRGIDGSRVHQILVIDDEDYIRTLCKMVLGSEQIHCDEADSGAKGLRMLAEKEYDLVIIDFFLGDMTGTELCQRIRETCTYPNLKIVIMSGTMSPDEMAKMLLSGGDDFLSKPFSVPQFLSRIQASLKLKDAQDRSERLNQHLLHINHQLEQMITATNEDMVLIRNSLVFGLAKVVDYREDESGKHLTRLQHYCRYLAETAAELPMFAGQITPPFIQTLECCVPLHDIGKVGLPDHILLKPGRLDPEERVLMQAHTTIGAEALKNFADQNPSSFGFLQMAIDIARHHHERFDGNGYPDRLSGTAIPLAARITSICDVYDGLRSRRSYKPALSHLSAVKVILEGSPGQFDPNLLEAFRQCSLEFERIHKEMSD